MTKFARRKRKLWRQWRKTNSNDREMIKFEITKVKVMKGVIKSTKR